MRTKPKPSKSAPPPATVVPIAPDKGLLSVPARMALATSRSNFVLMDALPVADWIDWVGGTREPPADPEPVPFLRFRYAGRSFLASINALTPFPFPLDLREQLFDDSFWRWEWLHRRPGALGLMAFAMEERSASIFLDGLSNLIREGSRAKDLNKRSLELPVHEVVGFRTATDDDHGRPTEDRSEYEYALFRDGLALIGKPPRRDPADLVIWDPKDGLSFM
jgi:hypothetical protein